MGKNLYWGNISKGESEVRIMLDRLVKLLKSENTPDKWLINYEQIATKELFFIKDRLDMNRAKDVEHCRVTLYADIDEDGKKYLGSATVKLSPSMSDDEMLECIKEGAYSATLAKNPYYTLVAPSTDSVPQLKSNIDYKNGIDTLQKVIDLVYSIDKKNTADVNSMEIFLQATTTKVINSEGVNETYSLPNMTIELVVDCKGEKEEVELYDMINISSFDEKMLAEKISAVFTNAQRRAKAKALSTSGDIPILLKGEAVRELFYYYIFKANANAIYKKYSQLKVGDSIQGDNVVGDKITITLLPEIPYSIASKYIDDDGTKLKELPLYKDGKLLSYHGNNIYSQYCNVDITGDIPNVKIHEGSMEFDDMLQGDCLEVIGFSDFQIDPITGDFGGEIRLAIHHSDGKDVPVTGGSITGNILKVHDNIYLSKQMDITGNCQHPKAVKIVGAKISS